jgi:hypothetical protein
MVYDCFMKYKNDSGYPSPSDILDVWIDKRWFKPEHSERGNNVHSAIHTALRGLVPIWKEGLDGYRDSFKLIEKYFEEAVLLEHRLVDKTLCYSGQLDAVMKLSEIGCSELSVPYPTMALVDWKTSLQPSKDWNLRLAAYFNLCIVNDIKCDLHLLVRIRKDGSSPKIKVSRRDEIRFYFSYFKAALNAWYFFKTNVVFEPKKSS